MEQFISSQDSQCVPCTPEFNKIGFDNSLSPDCRQVPQFSPASSVCSTTSNCSGVLQRVPDTKKRSGNNTLSKDLLDICEKVPPVKKRNDENENRDLISLADDDDD